MLGYVSFCSKGKVVGTKDLQRTRFTENQVRWEDVKVWAYWNHSLLESLVLLWASLLCCFPEFPQGSLTHPWGWLFSQTAVTSFVVPTHYSPGGRISDSSFQRGKGREQDLSPKGDEGGACRLAHIWHKFAGGLVKVVPSHSQQASLTEGFSRYEAMQELGT